MAYTPTNIPLNPTIQRSTFLFYEPQAASFSPPPGEATSSAYYPYGSNGILSPDHAVNSAHPGPLTPARRQSSDPKYSYPYPTSHHDTSRSPTRSGLHPHELNVLHPPIRSRLPSNGSDFVGPERHNKSYGRPCHKDDAPQSPRKPSKPPAPPASLNGPTNHILIPQTLFQETGSSKSHYPDIIFHVAGFPEMGVKVGALCHRKVPLLSRGEEDVFQSVQEREIKIRIPWPGYSEVSFEKHLKITSRTRTRIDLVIKLAQIVLEFASRLRRTIAQIESGQEQWMIDFSGAVGIRCTDVFITKLIHCGGSHWQMELWAPREMA